MHRQTDYSNNLLRRVTLANGLVSTLAGSPTQGSGYTDGVGEAATFSGPEGVAVDAAGSTAIIVRGGRGVETTPSSPFFNTNHLPRPHFNSTHSPASAGGREQPPPAPHGPDERPRNDSCG